MTGSTSTHELVREYMNIMFITYTEHLCLAEIAIGIIPVYMTCFLIIFFSDSFGKCHILYPKCFLYRWRKCFSATRYDSRRWDTRCRRRQSVFDLSRKICGYGSLSVWTSLSLPLVRYAASAEWIPLPSMSGTHPRHHENIQTMNTHISHILYMFIYHIYIQQQIHKKLS